VPLVLTCTVIASCGARGATRVTADAPSLTCTPEVIVTGEPVSLTWTTGAGAAVTIDGGIGPVAGASTSVTPVASTTFRLTAIDADGSTLRAGCSVVITPALPAPVIEALEAPCAVPAGASATLRWSVSGASSLTVDGANVPGPAGVLEVTPAVTTSYTLAATGPGGRVDATVTVAVLDAATLEPADPGAADVTLTLDASAQLRRISPWIYGYNAATAGGAPPGATWLRLGGNRWTAYDWETNASNAGSDWGPYANDAYLGDAAEGPAGAIIHTLDDARAHGLAVAVTVPIQGWVAADFAGPVDVTAPVAARFLPSYAFTGAASALSPDLGDGAVYQDELAALVARRWRGAATPLHLELDNEPELWGHVDASGRPWGTHPEIERTPTTYASLLSRSIRFASALRDRAPEALILGPASYGWSGFVALQDAPDAAAHGDFLEYYLATMRAASTAQGRRLLDALDVHWYSEARGCGVRVTDPDERDCVVAARVQAPRSLADPGYVEDSWITSSGLPSADPAIRLLSRLRARIEARDPGTLLTLSEYCHGGGAHVSGALAEADTLGTFGREGVYAAAFWPLGLSDQPFVAGAFRAFRDYDGAGHAFGDTSFAAASSDLDHVAVYASRDGTSAGRVVVVIIHRPTLTAGALDLRSRAVAVRLRHSRALATARVWQLTATTRDATGAVVPARVTAPLVVNNALVLTVPALSVTVLELTP
jgi:hypothetical protein